MKTFFKLTCKKSLIYSQIFPLYLHNLGGSVGKTQDTFFAGKCGREFKSHFCAFWKIFFSLLEKRGGRTLKFLGCLTPK